MWIIFDGSDPIVVAEGIEQASDKAATLTWFEDFVEYAEIGTFPPED